MYRLLLFVLILAISCSSAPRPGEAAGPWKAEIVDAETGKPLEGVIVLLEWHKMTRTFGGPSPEFYDAEEVVTGPDGRFLIARRRTITLNPLTYIDEPLITIFKPGYGSWRVRDWEKKPKEWEELSAAEVLEKDGIVLELPPLKTREERLKFYRNLQWGTMTPPERTRNMQEAVKVERRHLGFQN